MGDAGLPHSLQESLDNTKVSYAQLGKSGLRVSVPILGAMSFGKSTLNVNHRMKHQNTLSVSEQPEPTL
jgi:hypothetical protein